eukprot:Tbor_TRINITY_DN2442_c0_g1::TRINITY_DN2442_c0_g1_i1::g.2537::m.2537
MHRMLYALLVRVYFLLVLLTLGFNGVDAKFQPVISWTPTQVELWVNETLGLSEYSHYFRDNRVDGPTLLLLTIEDLEDTFKIINSLHAAKFSAHLALLREQCLCPQLSDSNVDFWLLVRSYPRRVWVWFPAALYCPRMAIVALYFFDSEAYVYLTSLTQYNSDGIAIGTEQNNWMIVAYWILGLLTPSTYLLLMWLPVVTTNFIVVLTTAPMLVIAQVQEVNSAILILNGEFKSLVFREKVFLFFPLVTLLPIITLVLSYIMPVLILQVAVWAFIAFSLLTSIGFFLLIRESKWAAEDSASVNETKKES